MKLSDIPDGMAFMCLTNLYVKFDGIDKNCFNPIDGIFYHLDEMELVSLI